MTAGLLENKSVPFQYPSSKKYSGEASPDVLDPTRFVLVQANILSALELGLKNLALPKA